MAFMVCLLYGRWVKILRMPMERKKKKEKRAYSNGKLLFTPAITISIIIIIIIHSQANVKKSRKNYSAGHILASHLPIFPYVVHVVHVSLIVICCIVSKPLQLKDFHPEQNKKTMKKKKKERKIKQKRFLKINTSDGF